MPTFATNRDAPYRYELEERFEAGILLEGPEVKSIRSGKASLTGSHVILRGGEAYLVNCHIAPYPPAQANNPDPERTRKLLLTKPELLRASQKLRAEGLTMIPVSLYSKGGFIKVELALARGKKKHDRRESIKKRDAQRRIERAVRDRQP